MPYAPSMACVGWVGWSDFGCDYAKIRSLGQTGFILPSLFWNATYCREERRKDVYIRLVLVGNSGGADLNFPSDTLGIFEKNLSVIKGRKPSISGDGYKFCTTVIYLPIESILQKITSLIDWSGSFWIYNLILTSESSGQIQGNMMISIGQVFRL